jgi:hypothetical protein
VIAGLSVRRSIVQPVDDAGVRSTALTMPVHVPRMRRPGILDEVFTGDCSQAFTCNTARRAISNRETSLCVQHEARCGFRASQYAAERFRAA